MEKFIKLKPLTSTAIWGDGQIVRKYNAEKYVPEDMNIDQTIGLTTISGYPGYSNEILSGSYKGMLLEELYQQEPELFGKPDELRWEYLPVSMGICYAKEDLSIQVHPSESYAQKHLGTHGKSESWYFVDCPPDGDIIMGHNAKSMEEFDQFVENKDMDGLIRKYPIKPDGFYNIEAGTLHAIQKGTTFIEVCNPSPITYRLYDYERTDSDGKQRELNIDLVRENIIIPFEESFDEETLRTFGDVTERKLTDNKNFSVTHFNVAGQGNVPKEKPYLGLFVIAGEGKIGDEKIVAGDSIIVTTEVDCLEFSGNLEILACHG